MMFHRSDRVNDTLRYLMKYTQGGLPAVSSPCLALYASGLELGRLPR